MKAALYYSCSTDSESDFLEQLIQLYHYALSLETTPCAMYLDCPKDKNSHPAYDQMMSDAKKELFSIIILYDFPKNCSPEDTAFCMLTLPKE